MYHRARMAATAVLACASSATAIVGVAAPGALPASAAESTTTWSVVATPNVVLPDARFTGVSCPMTTCVAVGQYVGANGQPAPLGAVGGGSGWKVTAVPLPAGTSSAFLRGITCVASNKCLAVGAASGKTQVPLAEVWSGTTWSVQPTSAVSGDSDDQLNAVSCTSAKACVAVGSALNSSFTGVPIAEVWNGSSWTVKAPAVPSGSFGSGLDSVSCTAGGCTAVGQFTSSTGLNESLVEHWSGSSWSLTKVPAPSGNQGASLSGVSCVSTNCFAVGSFTSSSGTDQTLGLKETGSTWAIVPTPNNSAENTNALSAVWCSAVNACTAVGFSTKSVLLLTTSVTLAERWTGTSWSMQTTSNPSGVTLSSLAGVACASATSCQAVGSADNVSLGEAWNGAKWTIGTMPNEHSVQNTDFNDMSCSSATFCMAVGDYSDIKVGLTAAKWNGTAWTQLTMPSPHIAASNFVVTIVGVSCTSASFCEAVGTYGDGMSGSSTLAEIWNGTSWAVQKTPNADAFGGQLFAVACTSTANCIAVGKEQNAFAEKWNGTSWALTTAMPGNDFFGIECTSATSCVAVGGNLIVTGSPAAADQWNGSTWSSVSVPVPSGSVESFVNDIACSSASSCSAVGEWSDSSGIGHAFATRWNGSSFGAPQSMPLPAGATGGAAGSIACPAVKLCLAVGNYSTDSTSKTISLAEGWNGSTWSVEPAATVKGFPSSSLSAVAASGTTFGLAVGSISASNSTGTVERTLSERES